MISKSIECFLILFSFVLLLKNPSVAQTGLPPNTSGFRIGIRTGGSSVLPLEAVENATYYPTVSYHGGLVFSIGRGNLTLQPELIYSQRHIRADYNQQGISLSAKVMTNRVEVPVLVNYSFGHSNTRFFMNGGPYGAYILNERYRASLISFGNANPALRPIIESVVAGLNNKEAAFEGNDGRISYGLAGGVGVGLKAGPGNLTLAGRALYELGDNAPANSPDPSGISITSNVRTTKYVLLQASIGYSIPIGSR